MKFILQTFCFIFPLCLSAQLSEDEWINAQLGEVVWQETYRGVLADYHPVTLMLASDHHQVAGYLIHEGDQQKHKLLGDWSDSGTFQLQERDIYDRLSGYLTGSVTPDQVRMKWLSPDQSRLFDVKAFPERLIKIKNFKPVSEYISLSTEPLKYITVQKMDFGVVSGLLYNAGEVFRFDGQCLDGTCSIWDASMMDAQGKISRIQMRQKDATYYKALVDGQEYKGMIRHVTPLTAKLFDNSTGFMDMIYPSFQSKVFNAWLSARIDSLWNRGINDLKEGIHQETTERLVYRASGWIEILDENEQYVSGMLTYIHPQRVERESFLWLKREDQFIPQEELMNLPTDLEKASTQALTVAAAGEEPQYRAWLQDTGYAYMTPIQSGATIITEFSMIYGDDFYLLSAEESKSLIKKKFWKYFNW